MLDDDGSDDDLDVYGSGHAHPPQTREAGFSSVTSRYDAPDSDRWHSQSQNPAAYTAQAASTSARPMQGMVDLYSCVAALPKRAETHCSARPTTAHSDEPSPRSPIVKGVNARPTLFGQSNGFQSIDSGLPLATSAALPAGRGETRERPLQGSQGWGLDDDDDEQIAARMRYDQKGKGKAREVWPRFRHWITHLNEPKDLEGERTIYINDAASNAPMKFKGNYVSTSKYNLVTFLPKFLAGPSTCWSVHAPLTSIDNRAIQQIRQRLLPLHGSDTTDTQRITYKSIYDYCPA